MGRRFLFLFVLLVAGCHKKAKVVVGVDAQPGVASQIGRVHVSASVGGSVVAEKDIVPKAATEKLAAPESPFPFEVPIDGAPGGQVDVTVEGYRAGPNSTVESKAMVVRRARAPFVLGTAPSLVRLQLESACVTGVPGFKGPACPVTQSCAGGRCIDPTLLAEDLEPYAANWATVRPDLCRPADAGAPVVQLGTGATDFLPLKEGQTLAPEKGPQGGHHLWIAVRMKNFRQTGTTVALTAEQPGTGLKVPPTSFVFPLERDEGGFCKLYGLRFQLDNATVAVARFLSQPLDLKVDVRDASGRTGEDALRVQVAATTVGD
jgi:hypothetical protein